MCRNGTILGGVRGRKLPRCRAVGAGGLPVLDYVNHIVVVRRRRQRSGPARVAADIVADRLGLPIDGETRVRYADQRQENA